MTRAFLPLLVALVLTGPAIADTAHLSSPSTMPVLELTDWAASAATDVPSVETFLRSLASSRQAAADLDLAGIPAPEAVTQCPPICLDPELTCCIPCWWVPSQGCICGEYCVIE
ncbi:MAG TPA: hypothetical protein VF017_19095 [Thermoanaerobaculia bacterium]|nr:hypothetical protein [Thermoanaerobaculia bacterium]